MKLKSIKVGDDEFNAYTANLCDIMQSLRPFMLQVTQIDIYKAGIKLFNKNNEQIASFSNRTLIKAQEDFNATFNH